MVRAGEDPAFIFRRMIILAMEDVGLADPQAITTVISCAEAFDRIGFPEGNFALSEACLCLATAPKSNSTLAYFDALKEVEKEDAEVPGPLRDASRDAESFGHGEGYIYPHAYRNHWAAQAYLPTALRGRVFYTPSISGHEGRIREEVLRKREIQAAVILGDAQGNAARDDEGLSWSASSKGREGWFKRLESGRSALLLADRDLVLGQLNVTRQHRVLVAAANDGLLLWESLRRVPEGLAAALVDSEGAKEALLKFAVTLDEIELPLVAVAPAGKLISTEEAEGAFSCRLFDHIVAREPWRRTGPEAFGAFADSAMRLLAPGGDVSVLQSPPRFGERISRILLDECGASAPQTSMATLAEKLKQAEEVFFSDLAQPDNLRSENLKSIRWDPEALEKSFLDAGFTVTKEIVERQEERLISLKDISLWFDAEKSSWGAFIAEALGEKDFSEIRLLLESRIGEGPVKWKWKSILIKAVKNPL